MELSFAKSRVECGVKLRRSRVECGEWSVELSFVKARVECGEWSVELSFARTIPPKQLNPYDENRTDFFVRSEF